MEARLVMIHQVQFSSFFLFISHIPVNAAAGCKTVCHRYGTVGETAEKKIQNSPAGYKKDEGVYPVFFGRSRNVQCDLAV